VGVAQVEKWLAELRAAKNDIRAAASVAQSIQRRVKPGRLHLAASECRIACLSAGSWTTESHVITAQSAIRSLCAELETLEMLLRDSAKAET
jgi:hypothetical protein